MENQLVLKSNIFLTNFVSILMTIQLGLGFLSLTSLITVSAGAFLQLVVFLLLYVFSILLDKKIPYWDVMFAGATVVTVAINNSPEMVSLFVFSMIMSIFWKLSPVLNIPLLLKRYFVAGIFIFFIVVFASVVFGFNNNVISMWRIDGVVNRQSLGFSNPNAALISLVAPIFSGIGYFVYKQSRIGLLGLLIIVLFVFEKTQSRTSSWVIVSIIVAMFITLKNGLKPVNRFLKGITLVMPFLFLAFSMWLMFKNPDFFNIYLSGRPNLYHNFYQQYGIHLLGQSELENAMFDNSYLQALLSKGLLFLVLFLFINIRNIYIVRRVPLVAWMLFGGLFALGVTETVLQHFEIYVSIIMVVFLMNGAKSE